MVRMDGFQPPTARQVIAVQPLRALPFLHAGRSDGRPRLSSPPRGDTTIAGLGIAPEVRRPAATTWNAAASRSADGAAALQRSGYDTARRAGGPGAPVEASSRSRSGRWTGETPSGVDGRHGP